jgi:hypothetical protein
VDARDRTVFWLLVLAVFITGAKLSSQDHRSSPVPHLRAPEIRKSPMPPTAKSTPSAGGSVKPAEWRMPRPPAVVVWRNAPGGETAYAIVTKYNKNSVSLMIFPPESRIGVPKDGVRFIADPWNATNGINADSGVWEYTPEHELFMALVHAEAERNTPAK